MKNLTLVLLTLFITTIASAKCGNNDITCLTKSSTLNKNGLIILEFYAESQSLIPELNNKYPIYLKSSNKKVQLTIIETLKGEMSLTQIVLKPSSALKANEVYTLVIDNLPVYERTPARYNSTTKKWEAPTFKITNTVDTEIPTFSNTPTENKKTLVEYGCGPGSWVYFDMVGQDNSELFVRASVKNKATGQTTTYILGIENGLVKVGHGMCSGAFHFNGSTNFEATFQLFDQSGNKSAKSEVITFAKPAFVTSEE